MVVIIGAVVGLLVMMVKYANHIHHFPQEPDRKDDDILGPDKNKGEDD